MTAVVERFWSAMQANDWRAAAELFVEDIVVDWPCSGERIVGRADYVALQERYPTSTGRWQFDIHRIVAPRVVAFSEVVGDRIARRGRPRAGVTGDSGVVRRLTVEANLRLDLGGRPARLTGSGSELTLLLTDPADALSQVGAALPPRAGRLTPRRLGWLANGLQAAGLRLTIRGPGGALLVLGQGGPEPLRWLTRSPYVAPGRPLAVALALAGLVLRRLRRRGRPN